MNRNDDQFMERASRDLAVRSMACKVLGVADTAGIEELKKAYRMAALKLHPDKNINDPDAVKKFTLVKCAYELLAEDKECPELLEEINSWSGVPQDDKYNLENSWGHFLWWREKFFG